VRLLHSAPSAPRPVASSDERLYKNDNRPDAGAIDADERKSPGQADSDRAPVPTTGRLGAHRRTLDRGIAPLKDAATHCSPCISDD